MSLLEKIRWVAAGYDHCYEAGSARRELVFILTIAPVLFGIVALVVAVVSGR